MDINPRTEGNSMNINFAFAAPPDSWRRLARSIRYPHTGAVDRLSDGAADLWRKLKGERDAARRANLLTVLSAISANLAQLTRYDWTEQDIRMLRLDAAILDAAAASETALVAGERQPIDPKLPGTDLWLELQDEPDRERRALIYGKLSDIIRDTVDVGYRVAAAYTIGSLADSEHPLDDPQRGDTAPPAAGSWRRLLCWRQAGRIAATGTWITAAVLLYVHAGWRYLLAGIGLWIVAEYADAVISRIEPMWELRRLAARRHGRTIIEALQAAPCVVYAAAIMTFRRPLATGRNVLLIIAVVFLVFFVTKMLIRAPEAESADT
jgi:hypothetical protein